LDKVVSVPLKDGLFFATFKATTL